MIRARKVNGGIYFVGAISNEGLVKIALAREKVLAFFNKNRASENLTWFECRINEKDISEGLDSLRFSILDQGFSLDERHVKKIKEEVVHYIAFELGFRALREPVKKAIAGFFAEVVMSV
jgi:hypothetical protein